MERIFKDDEVVLFQGDSVTDCSRDRDDYFDLGDGYPKKVKKLYDTLFPANSVRFVNRGVSGDRSKNLLERYDDDILAIKPDYISIMIGINNTWRKFDCNDETTIEKFVEEYTLLLEKIKHDFPKAKIMLITPYVLHSLPDREAWHPDLDPKIAAVLKLAEKYADYVLDIQSIFNSAVENGTDPRTITADGVHPCDYGHSFVALEYLKAFGVI
ncbi:MAG: SGNH/GDSL hydrolase family protein [Clostridiales bacterium]|nr:SGNH/GDSL hydrolase family protein [Clostridiales bacterium]